MAVSESQGGTHTISTLSTEETPTGLPVTVAGTYIFAIDTGNLVNGESLVMRIKVKNRSGSTEHLAYEAIISHAQVERIKFSPPVPAPHSINVTLEQIGGTARAFEWALLVL